MKTNAQILINEVDNLFYFCPSHSEFIHLFNKYLYTTSKPYFRYADILEQFAMGKNLISIEFIDYISSIDILNIVVISTYVRPEQYDSFLDSFLAYFNITPLFDAYGIIDIEQIINSFPE